MICGLARFTISSRATNVLAAAPVLIELRPLTLTRAIVWSELRSASVSETASGRLCPAISATLSMLAGR